MELLKIKYVVSYDHIQGCTKTVSCKVHQLLIASLGQELRADNTYCQAYCLLSTQLHDSLTKIALTVSKHP